MDGINRPEPLRIKGNLEDNWRRFKRDYDLFMTATGRDAQSKDVQAATLLNLIGSEAIDVFETLDVSEADKKDPEKIITAFQNYVEPQKNEIYERFLFLRRKRNNGEKLEHYISDLKKIARNCNYGTLTDSLIRDNIIYHMSDLGLQQSALKCQDLQLESLIKMMREHDIIRSQTNDIQGGTMQRINDIRINTRQDRYSNDDNIGMEGRCGDVGERRIPDWRSRVEVLERYRTKSASRIGYWKDGFTCKRCNGQHGPNMCPAFGKQCEKCLKYNHSALACQTMESSSTRIRDIFGSECDSSEEIG
ncbi:uncharacterized protein LOC117223276 [Megalopta genalis]|uniref:uncharacterized protein LOC117223276 n=1 Tax=Megalopta genalis TaxID=115081 RepID=UPI003FD633A7